jgi:hypothetical protein
MTNNISTKSGTNMKKILARDAATNVVYTFTKDYRCADKSSLIGQGYAPPFFARTRDMNDVLPLENTNVGQEVYIEWPDKFYAYDAEKNDYTLGENVWRLSTVIDNHHEDEETEN